MLPRGGSRGSQSPKKSGTGPERLQENTKKADVSRGAKRWLLALTCRWLPPYGFLGKIDRISPEVGGSFHMSFTNFGSGHSHSFESTYLELVPVDRIRLADKFDDPGLAGNMTKTITLRTVSCGTEIEILHEGLPAAIPAEMCYLGWQESLLQLARLVEPEIPGGE